MICQNYADSSLCLAQIAASLKLSSGYVGKLFKDIAGVSLNEYINEIRLVKAAEWLEKSDIPVGDILSRVGVENETYFYSLFKKKYGLTPKEYAMKVSLRSKFI